jgi:hypothetical protein
VVVMMGSKRTHQLRQVSLNRAIERLKEKKTRYDEEFSALSGVEKAEKVNAFFSKYEYCGEPPEPIEEQPSEIKIIYELIHEKIEENYRKWQETVEKRDEKEKNERNP